MVAGSQRAAPTATSPSRCFDGCASWTGGGLVLAGHGSTRGAPALAGRRCSQHRCRSTATGSCSPATPASGRPRARCPAALGRRLSAVGRRRARRRCRWTDPRWCRASRWPRVWVAGSPAHVRAGQNPPPRSHALDPAAGLLAEPADLRDGAPVDGRTSTGFGRRLVGRACSRCGYSSTSAPGPTASPCRSVGRSPLSGAKGSTTESLREPDGGSMTLIEVQPSGGRKLKTLRARLGPEAVGDSTGHLRRRARQDRPAAGGAVRGARATGSSAPTSTSASSSWSTRCGAVPRRGRPGHQAQGGRRGRAADARPPTPRRRSPSGRGRRGRAAVRRRRRRARTSAGWTPRPRRSPPGCKPGTLVSYETTLPVGTTRTRWAPMLEEGSGLTAGTDFHLVFSPERVLTGRVFADLRRYPKLVGGIDEASAARGVEFYEAVLDFDERADLARPNGVWDLGSAEAAELAKLAETTYRDVNIGLANQFARFADTHRHRRHEGHRGLQLPAVQPHPPARHRRRRPLHPDLPADVPVERPGGDRRPRRRARPTRRCRTTRSTCWPPPTATWPACGVLVLGAAYRGGVKETAFSGVFPTVEALQARGARRRTSPTRCTRPTSSTALGPARRTAASR